MPSPIVKVGFDPATTPPTWTISPMIAGPTTPGTANIVFQEDPDSAASFTFVSVNGLPAGWQKNKQGNGQTYVVVDPNTDSNSYEYTVTILYNSTEYTSPTTIGPKDTGDDDPPIIRNDGSVPAGQY